MYAKTKVGNSDQALQTAHDRTLCLDRDFGALKSSSSPQTKIKGNVGGNLALVDAVRGKVSKSRLGTAVLRRILAVSQIFSDSLSLSRVSGETKDVSAS